MRFCKAYLRLYKDQGPDVKLCCKDCNRKLHKHGRYFRWVASKCEHILIPIYRWLCPNCGTTVSLFPDFLIPWARFTKWVRESACASFIVRLLSQFCEIFGGANHLAGKGVFVIIPCRYFHQGICSNFRYVCLRSVE